MFHKSELTHCGHEIFQGTEEFGKVARRFSHECSDWDAAKYFERSVWYRTNLKRCAEGAIRITAQTSLNDGGMMEGCCMHSWI